MQLIFHLIEKQLEYHDSTNNEPVNLVFESWYDIVVVKTMHLMLATCCIKWNNKSEDHNIDCGCDVPMMVVDVPMIVLVVQFIYSHQLVMTINSTMTVHEDQENAARTDKQKHPTHFWFADSSLDMIEYHFRSHTNDSMHVQRSIHGRWRFFHFAPFFGESQLREDWQLAASWFSMHMLLLAFNTCAD